jgi:hypothetical protein
MPDARLPLPADDIAILVCSDTPGGMVAGVCNAAALTGGDLRRIRYLDSPEAAPARLRGCAVVVRVPGLDAGDADGKFAAAATEARANACLVDRVYADHEVETANQL